MATTAYKAGTEGAVSLTAATAKSVLGVNGTSAFGVDLQKFRLSFDGITASAIPVLVELCYCTFGANPPGTNSTSVTVTQTLGRTITPGFVAAKTWTTEPTTITVIDEWLLTPAGGLVIYDFPLGTSPDSAVSNGFVIRCNAPAAVAVRGAMHFGRC
jgi:hypothetical protein